MHSVWEKGPRKKLLAGNLLKRKEDLPVGKCKNLQNSTPFPLSFLCNSTQVSDMRTKQRGLRSDRRKRPGARK